MPMTEKKPLSKAKAAEVMDRLEALYPDAGPELKFSNRFELLVATMLSAQCTDVRVNIVTAELFRALPTPEAMLSVPLEELTNRIRTCGLSNSKAANIQATCRILLDNHGGQVPGTLEELTALPGVGRKTANVVLSNGFGVPAIAVDTHVFRVANRIGLTAADTVEKTELQLMAVLPRKRWSHSHHVLIFHGRRCCKARKPECDRCPVRSWCRFYQSVVK